MGYALESGIPFSEGLIKNRYVGRTFIEPEQKLRDLGVRQKFNSLGDVIRGKRIVVVDDSIVRGTTTPHVVSLLRRAGAAEVHMRVCAPPIAIPASWGWIWPPAGNCWPPTTPSPKSGSSSGADTLGYLSVEGLMAVVGGQGGGSAMPASPAITPFQCSWNWRRWPWRIRRRSAELSVNPPAGAYRQSALTWAVWMS